MRRYTVALTLAVALLPTVVIGQVAAGPEFRVNAFTTGQQLIPRIASDAAGNFVVTWSNSHDGNSFGAFARRYDASGTPFGSAEFRLNAFTTGFQAVPAVAATPDGRLFFAWTAENQDGSGLGIYARRFDAAGTPAGGEFRVNSYTFADQRTPSIGADGSGNFVVIWNDFLQDGLKGLFGQRYDSGGSAAGDEFRVNSYTTSLQSSYGSAIAMAGDGRFVVVWQSYAQDGHGYSIFAQRYDAAGVAAGSEFQVNDYMTSAQTRPSVASDPAGNFVVVWTGDSQPGGFWRDIVARRYDASGVAQGGEFIVNSDTAGHQAYPSVALDARSGFVVAWHGAGEHDSYDVFARAFDSSGPTGAQFRVGAYRGVQRDPSVASNAVGDFVVAWTDYGADGAGDIVARRFLSDLIFRDDFES